MKYLNRKNLFWITLMLALSSCVPIKQYQETKSDATRYRDNNQLLKEENQEYLVQNKELEGKYDQARMKLVQLQQDMEKLQNESHTIAQEKERIKKMNEELDQQINALKQGSSKEITNLLSELQTLQENLQEREDKVRAAEKEILDQQQKLKDTEGTLAEKQQKLNTTEKALAEQQTKLKSAQDSLTQQQAKMIELQEALNKQRAAVSELKDKVRNALVGFNDQGLTVYEKNGKVYVSMEDKLLFKIGSYNLDTNGQKALNKLGEVLATNPDINVMVEGHTDNVPLTGTGALKDNWDLSVMRATAVIKIILSNQNIDPKRIIAAGRSEYIPLQEGNSPEARQKNRRTEIILTPNLSEIFNIIQSN